MMYQFSIELAVQVGSDKATILTNFYYWFNKNRLNNVNYYEGTYWTYNTVKALAQLFPWLPNSTLRRYLNELYQDGYILKGKFSPNKFDRTNYYALTPKTLAYFENSERTSKLSSPVLKSKPSPFKRVTSDIKLEQWQIDGMKDVMDGFCGE